MNSALLTLICFVAAVQTDDRTKLKWFEENAYKAAGLAQDGKKQASLKLIAEMAKEAESQKNEERQLYVQMYKGVCEFYIGDLNQSILTLKDMETKNANVRFRHQLHRHLGDAYLGSGQAKQAEDHLKTALKLNAQAKVLRFPPEDLVSIKIMLAGCTIAQGGVKDARKELNGLKRDIDTIKKEADPTDWACLNARWKMLNAEVDLDARNPLRALVRLDDSQKSLRPFSPKSREAADLRFRCHIALAADYWLLARFADAATQLDLAEGIVSSVKTDRNQATIKNARAALLIEKSILAVEDDPTAAQILDDLNEAETYLDKALTHLKANTGEDMLSATVQFQLAQVYDLRGRVLAATNKNKEAQVEFLKGRQRCDNVINWYNRAGYPGEHVSVLEIRNRRSWLNLRLGDAKGAEQEGIDALKLFDKNHPANDLDRGRYLHVLIEAENKLGNTAAAAKYADEQRRHVDDGLGMILAGLSAPEQVQFFRRWDTPAFNASLRLGVQHAKDQELVASSVEWLINGKAKVTEVLAAQVTMARDDKKVLGKFQSAIQREAFLLYGQPTAEAKVLRAQLLLEEASKRDLAEEATATLKPGKPRWFTLREVRENLADGEIYVGIHSMRSADNTERRYEAWVLPKQGAVQMVKLGDAQEIDDLVKLFVREQQNVPLIAPGQERRAEQLLRDKVLRRLSNLVLEPIRSAVGDKRRWVVSPDGPLWNVPWAALILPETDKYAIEEITFRYAISGRDLVRDGAKGKAGQALVLGDPWFNYPNTDPQRLRKPGIDPLRIPWDRLEYSERDCDTVFTIMQSSNLQPRRFTGLFQKERLFELPQPPRMMYLSTHAFATLPSKVPVDDPLMQCALALAGWNYLPESKESLPGMMTGAELLAMDLRGTELVVLSSCESEPELVSSGQSPANLRHAFHLAGARAVVSSLWGINDRSTLDVMEPFMDAACQANGDKVTALRDAQQQAIRYLRMYRDHSHPYFWASFTISGS